MSPQRTPLFLLNFSTATYVRDAGVAGSNPATPTIYFCHSFFRAFSDCWRFPSQPGSQPRIPCLKRNINMRSRGSRKARGLPNLVPQTRGSRECRVLAAPAVSCAMCRGVRTRAYRYSRSTPAFPAQWVYGLCRALPGDEFVLSPSPRGLKTCQSPVGPTHLRKT